MCDPLGGWVEEQGKKEWKKKEKGISHGGKEGRRIKGRIYRIKEGRRNKKR